MHCNPDASVYTMNPFRRMVTVGHNARVLFKVGGRQSEKKRRNGDRRAICNSTRGIDAGRGVIRHRGVSDGSDGARPLWRSQSAQTEMFVADALRPRLLSKSLADLRSGLSSSKIWLFYKSNLVAFWMHLHNCSCFQDHLTMLLQSLRALCSSPGGTGSISNLYTVHDMLGRWTTASGGLQDTGE